MKLFYKKDYKKVCEVLKDTEKKVLIKENNIDILQNELQHRLNEIVDYKKKLLRSDDEISCMQQKIKEQANKQRILTRNNNRINKKNEELKKELEETKEKLKESMTDKYVLKKIPSGRTPNTIKTKSPRGMSSAVRRFMKEEFDR